MARSPAERAGVCTGALTMMIDLSGKGALVTGASRGIGAATARRLAACGASVFIAGIDSADRFEAVLADCRARAPSKDARFAYGDFDFTQRGAAEQMVDAAAISIGRI